MEIDSPTAIGISTGFGIPTGGTANQVLSKVDGTNFNTQWVNGVTGVTSTISISGSTTAPTKGTVLQDYITIQDDGSGWCTCEYAFYQSVASASAGSGVYLFTLPGGYQFDTSVHQVWTPNADYGTTNAIRYIIPGSTGIVGGSTAMANSVAFAYSSTQFRLSMGGEQIYGTPTLRTNVGSSGFALNNATITYNGSFRFKKA
jgi:hypothetical protein